MPRETLDQSSNQAQEFLFLRSVMRRDQKGSELYVCRPVHLREDWVRA
jgi:hypothetical protein